MPKNPLFATVRALVVVGLVLAGFFTLIKTSSIDNSLMSHLSLPQSGIPGVKPKPSSAEATSPTSSTLAEFKVAAKADPSHTGIYSTIWSGKNNAAKSAILTVDLLPSANDAETAASQNLEEFLSPSALKAYAKVTHFSVPGIPYSTAAEALTAKTSSIPASYSEFIGFRVNKVFALVVIGEPNPIAHSVGIGLAQREYQLLKTVSPSFSLVNTTHPVGYSLLYLIGGAGLALFSFGGMHWITQARERRQAHQEALARYHYHSRGSKVLRRKAATTRRR